ncbi:MAG: polymer-forming cytoskeletal protein [Candidatus Zixiibacteriota bacterium]|nr:MAG: polymer-forming cytoskeletal protein [candidate division Zixibacteria bacterium]
MFKSATTSKTAGTPMRNGSELATIIGHDATLEGKLTVKHDMRVEGQVKGELSSTDTITVGSTGKVEGLITAENVVVGGQVDGTIKASGRITLEAGSRFTGDLEAARLVITEGATFNGHSTMTASGSAAGSASRQIRLDSPGEARAAGSAS